MTVTAIEIFESLSYISPALIEDADMSRRYPRKPKLSKTARTLLIAAVLASLLAATAYATGFFGLAQRTYINGSGKSIVSPNGYIDSAEFNATVEWVEYISTRDRYKDPRLSFAESDKERSTCRLYGAGDGEAAKKLYDIADKYSLTLYSGSVSFEDDKELYELAGLEPFSQLFGDMQGYVFAGGSFKAEGKMELDGGVYCTVHKICSGALYPYIGVVSARGEYEERSYTTARGYTVNVVRWTDGRAALCWNSEDIFITVSFNDEIALDTLHRIADSMELNSMCAGGGTAADILSVERGIEANAEAARVFEDFYNSPAFQASMEFSSWLRQVFYGNSFTGVYAQQGYADIDAQMDALCEKYGLIPALSKEGGDIAEYSNGARYEKHPDYTLHYIPKTALYTRLEYFAPFTEYSKLWEYETVGGARVYIASEGPERRSCVHILYETESAYTILNMHTYDVKTIETAADAVDWSLYK